jgi:hypothetical protein
VVGARVARIYARGNNGETRASVAAGERLPGFEGSQHLSLTPESRSSLIEIFFAIKFRMAHSEQVILSYATNAVCREKVHNSHSDQRAASARPAKKLPVYVRDCGKLSRLTRYVSDIAWTIAVSDADIISQTATSERLLAAVTSDHRLSEQTEIDIGDFRSESLIVFLLRLLSAGTVGCNSF